MLIGTRLLVLTCCCAGLTACAASAPPGPNATVTAPSIARPQPPPSAQAALSQEAFTPYAAVGQSNNDGLAPEESNFALAGACLSAAGYPNAAGTVSLRISLGAAGLAFAQPWGGWGYLGTAEAEQYGFLVPPGSALSALGIGGQGSDSPPSLPPAEQAAAGTCGTIAQNFMNAEQDGALAGIGTLSNDINADVQRDAAVKQATRTWSACMSRNGYSYRQPQDVYFQELRNTFGGHGPINTSDPVSAAAGQAQVAAAVSDAACTQSADLAGIYFAVQASYEQQLVSANQPALSAAVQRYRAAYRQELGKLPALVTTG